MSTQGRDRHERDASWLFLPQRKEHHLRRNKEFQTVYRQGRFFASPDLVLYCLPQEDAQKSRIGYSVARKAGSAVTRNRVKRRMRELVRHHAGKLPSSGYDFVLLARQAAVDKSFQVLETTYTTLISRFLHWCNQARRH
ncbi:MAG: ribonuclease P protein component [Symbiobacteriaceae bacterium]|nr:ribonuclease P protein component [Symbiobacteriaceae bacterium]